MPCQHLAQIQQLNLPISNSDVLKVICPVCGNIEVCAYTPMDAPLDQENAASEPAGPVVNSATSEADKSCSASPK